MPVARLVLLTALLTGALAGAAQAVEPVRVTTGPSGGNADLHT